MNNTRYANIDNFLSYCYTAGLHTMFKLDNTQTFFTGKCFLAETNTANLSFDMATQQVKISFASLAKKYNRDWISYFSELSPRLAESVSPADCYDFKLHVQTERNGIPTVCASFVVRQQPMVVQRVFSCLNTVLNNIKKLLPVIDIITDGEYVTFPAVKSKDVIDFNVVQESLRLINQAFTYTSEGKYSEAIATATRAIQLNPSNAYAYNNRGYAQSMLLRGYSKEAAADYKKAIILHPREKTFCFNAGDIELCAGNYTKAKQLFEQALSIDPSYADATQMLDIVKKRMEQ